MPARLVALDEGPDIALGRDGILGLGRDMVVVGRHPACDARLDSLRVSRHHCCITREDGDLVVRDLDSTNGIRINGQRVEIGRLQVGDELSIAHLRYLLVEDFPDQERAVTPPRDPIDLPPDGSTAPWIWVRPSAWGFGPMNRG
jgi:pSer/pThr/pTyr-binding forkhead associated (FHA) protein